MYYGAHPLDFSDILNSYNVQWKEHLEKNKEALKEAYDMVKDFEIKDVYDEYNFYIRFTSQSKPDSARIYAYRDKKTKEYHLNFHTTLTSAQQYRIQEVLSSFPFDKIKGPIKKKREALLLEEMKSRFVGLSICDVVDNGEVIQVKMSDEKLYPYNNFGNISRQKEMYGLS